MVIRVRIVKGFLFCAQNPKGAKEINPSRPLVWEIKFD